MPEILRIVEEKNDRAQVITALSSLIEQASGATARVQLAMQVANQIHALEMEHAQGNRDIQGRLFDIYEGRMDTLSQERSLLQFFTLGFFGGRSWEERSRIAREEIANLTREIRSLQAGQIVHAVAVRIPLFEFVLGSREGALELAESLLRSLAPEEYQMLQQIAAPGANQQGSPETRGSEQ